MMRHRCGVLALLVVGFSVNAQAGGAVNDWLAELRGSMPAWLKPAETCPADGIPERIVVLQDLGGLCQSEPARCSDRCADDDGAACYALALAVQEAEDGDASEALFDRSCRLGVASGCTNRAAGMMDRDGVCAVRTFEKTCALDDPWGCTMFGMLLIRGEDIPQDLERAKKVLQGSCKYGEVDDACRYARSLLQRIEDGP